MVHPPGAADSPIPVTAEQQPTEAEKRAAEGPATDLAFTVEDLGTLWAYHVAIAADGSRAIAGGSEGQVRVWDLATGEERALEGHAGIVVGAAVSTDGSRAVTCATDDTVKVWDLDSGTRVHALEGQLSMGSGVGISADGSRVVHVTKDGMLHTRDAATGEEVSSLFVGEVYGLAVSADATQAVCVSESFVRVWDLVGLKPRGTLEGLSGKGIRVALSGDGSLAVSRCSDDSKPFRIWITGYGQELFGFPGDYIWGTAISSDGTRAMAFGTDVTREETDEEDEETIDTLRVWDLRSGAELLSHREEDIPTVNEVAMTADGSMAISSDGSNRIRLWRFSSGTAQRPETTARPVLSEEQVRESQAWFQKGFDSIFRGYEEEAVCYLRALEIDPNMRKAWSSFRDASLTAGVHDVVAGCDEAMRILDNGGVIEDFKDLLPMI